MPSSFLDALAQSFDHVENRYGQVGAMWLHPEDIERHLVREDVFDPIFSEHKAAMGMTFGPPAGSATLEGYLWNARVYGTNRVPKGHVIVVPIEHVDDVAPPDFKLARPLAYPQVGYKDDVVRISRFRRRDPFRV